MGIALKNPDYETDRMMCSGCDEIYSVEPFKNMNPSGAPLYTKFGIYDTEVNLCPKCTRKLYNFLKELRKDTLTRNNYLGLRE